MAMMKFTEVGEYLIALSEKDRDVLLQLRKIVFSVAPDAKESIYYGMPGFHRNWPLVCYAAPKNFYSLYPMSGSLTMQMKADIKGYETTKWSIHFPKDKPLPVALIKKILKFRMKENLETMKQKEAKKKNKLPAKKVAKKVTKKPAKKVVTKKK